MPDTRLKSIKVVAVDDNADGRALLKVILKLSSAEAAVVGSGQEALRAIKKILRRSGSRTNALNSALLWPTSQARAVKSFPVGARKPLL